jgi:hypothetical protein
MIELSKLDHNAGQAMMEGRRMSKSGRGKPIL